VLCENKAKPVMQCKGKCYLKKKIKQAEEKEQKSSSSILKDSLDVFVTECFKFKCYIFQTDRYLIPAILSDLPGTLNKIFQPPKFYSVS
jgi:hypothetical protein